MGDFITDVERQYEVYCKIAEEHGFIDLNAKKNGFRCTTKSNEFSAGWIAFVGAVAAVRDDQLKPSSTTFALNSTTWSSVISRSKKSTMSSLQLFRGILKNVLSCERVDEYKELTTSIRNEFDLWSDDSEFADVVEAQIENLEALRGASDQHLPR